MNAIVEKPINYAAMQMSLISLIGHSLDVELMLSHFLPKGLKMLNAKATRVRLNNHELYRAPSDLLSSSAQHTVFPRIDESRFQRLWRTLADDFVVENGNLKLEKTIHRYIEFDDSHMYCFPMGDAGVWFIARKNRFADEIIEALIPVAKQLGQACLACQNYAQAKHACSIAYKADKAKEEFLANISHELRTPLNSISGFTELLLMRCEDDHNLRDLKLIKQSSQHLLSLINQILDFSKVESGMSSSEISEFNLREFISDTLLSLENAALSKDLYLNGYFADNLPDIIRIDLLQLRQILLNVVGNAIKFTDDGGVTIKINADVRPDYVVWYFQIIDTGIGIENEKIESILSPFQQGGEDIAQRFGGTGLGLSIAKRLVESMHGKLKISSEQGKGTNVTFHLRCEHAKNLLADDYSRNKSTDNAITETDQSAMDDSPVEPSGSVDKESADGQDGSVDQTEIASSNDLSKIVLFEDHDINRDLLANILETVGFEVHAFADATSGLSKIIDLQPDVILMDMKMPEISGVEAASMIRSIESEHQRRTPIVALTANTRESDKRACLEAGMNDFLSKPVNTDALIGMLEKFGAHAQANQ